jgi:large subunit ribosomal protein L28
MAFKCDYCGRGVQYGETSKHHRGVAGAQWKKRAQKTRKVFKPNLHTVRVQVATDKVKMRLCTKCLRKLRKPYVGARGATV